MEYSIRIKMASLERILKILEKNPEMRVSLAHRDFAFNIYRDEEVDEDYLIGYEEKESFDAMAYELPAGHLPEDVTENVNLTYKEILVCYRYECFLAAIVLCGKIIETILSALFESVGGEKADKLGFHSLRSRLKKAGYSFEASLDSQFHVINAHRNKAVHGNIVVPSRDEARGIIYLTKDVMHKAVNKPN